MKLYQCHKRVRAAKIVRMESIGGVVHFCLEGGTKVPADAAWITRNPKSSVGGYYVEYEDGYTAYSPAEPFEEGYSLVEEQSA